MLNTNWHSLLHSTLNLARKKVRLQMRYLVPRCPPLLNVLPQNALHRHRLPLPLPKSLLRKIQINPWRLLFRSNEKFNQNVSYHLIINETISFWITLNCNIKRNGSQPFFFQCIRRISQIVRSYKMPQSS